MAGGDSQDALVESALLWLIGQGAFEQVVRDACDILVGGWAGSAVAELAGLSIHADRWSGDAEQVVHDALIELDRELPPRGTDAAQAAAVTAMCRTALAHRIIPRELAAWAHRAVGHDGVWMAQALVELDDQYDLCGTRYGGDSHDLDARILDYCRSVVESPSVGRGTGSEAPPREA